MLTAYQNRTRRLLQYPIATPTALYADSDITDWINQARGQVAGEGQCILAIGTLSTVIGQRAYNFSALNLGTPLATGIDGAINLARITYNVGTGQKWITPRPWPWFDFYRLNNPTPVDGTPDTWAQFGQGASGGGAITGKGLGTLAGGTFWLDPAPDAIYVLNCLANCYPRALGSDQDVEAIPYLWTDAVPYYAAYLALLSAQSGQREGEAARMFERYQTFMDRALRASAPTWLRNVYKGQPDTAQLAKMQIGKGGGQ